MLSGVGVWCDEMRRGCWSELVGLRRLRRIGARRWPVVPFALVLEGFVGCGDGSEGIPAMGPSAPPFDEIFTLEARIELEEADSALITMVPSLDVDELGRLLIPEPTAGEARIYDPDGRLLNRLGRRGDGPGEFQRPAAAVFGPGGAVYVSDIGSPRITRFAPGLEIDTTFELKRAHFGGPMEVVPGGIVSFAMRAGPDALIYDVYGHDGVRRASFHRLHPLIRTDPGWISAARGRLAVGGGRIFVAENLLYPVYRYDFAGRPVDSLGGPPPSWRPVSRPEHGTFQGPLGWSRFARWRRTFTTIAGLGIHRDSLLLVAHEALDPDVIAYEEATYRLDVYSLGAGVTKLYEDIPLPGRLLHVGDRLYLLLGQPPELGAWTLGRYRMEDACCAL